MWKLMVGDRGRKFWCSKQRLDAHRMNQLRPNLALLGVADLYAFLGMEQCSSPRSLWDRADGINREILNIGRTDPKSNARKVLCGECLALFRTDAEKQKYDNALAFERMEGLRKIIES